ncbi:glycosyltransferase family 2 protein [Litoreibacter albidus]|uniref:Glycosyl transferase family 2 n=1 Tax=Litoreibacter albidus TaxID=670155 RepID=A0A1H2XRD0_9RHOB|nr:glycosyltransferase family 2 protein [Litoreibacter albidus]SDW95387.1 Glycosyl transferase family 2 [Litoreibacter albidus]
MTQKHLILTCMKNEGPYILEWVAYHMSIGFDHFLVYINDCEDGTDKILRRLANMGIVTLRHNPAREGARASHQVRAYRKSTKEQVYKDHDWVAVIDADEFVNIHAGSGNIRDLTAAAPDAKCISLAWRLFGSADVTAFHDGFLTETLRRAAPEHCPEPTQAWGFKSIHRTDAVDIVGCHRPKSVPNDDWAALNWAGPAGTPMPESYFKNSWRMNRKTISYDLGQINHYAVRTRESFLLKSARGRAFGEGIRGADYWEDMNRNETYDVSIQPKLGAMKDIYEDLVCDPKLGRLHDRAVQWHRDQIQAVMETDTGRALMEAITPSLDLFPGLRKRVAA